mgnify:CR=1 FL=1
MLLSIQTKKMIKTMKPVQNGFSLLEMLIVVSIILILATVAVPKFTSASKTAKIAKIEADLRTISNAAALYEIDNGTYPANISALVTKDANGKSYLQFEPTLPDGTAYGIDENGIVSGTFENVMYDSATNRKNAG